MEEEKEPSKQPPESEKKEWPMFYVVLAILGYMAFQIIYIWFAGD